MAEYHANTVDEVQLLVDGIVGYKQNEAGADSPQEWIDGALTRNAGATSEWYVLALSQSGNYDFSSYEKALKEYLANHTIASAASRQKYALALAAIGSTDSYIASVMEDSIGQQGIMSWIYGLHLLNNGYTGSLATTDTAKQQLLSLQLEDGGWAVMGIAGDTDVTAMAVQALAPYYGTDDTVKAAVDKALLLLSQRQMAEGDCTGYGGVNPESTAQVLTALSSLGIDCTTDTRFIKNGNTLLDGLKIYQLEDGSFCHTIGGGSNETATVQSLYSLVSYIRMKNGQSPLYILDHCSLTETPDTAPSDTAPESQTGENETEELLSGKTEKGSYKLGASVGILLFAGVLSLILYLRGKGNKKNLIVVWIVAVLALGVVFFTDFKSAEDYYNGEGVEKENVTGTVTLAIRCDTLVGKSDSQYIPPDGVILEKTEFSIEEGDTVYDILVEATRKYMLQMENTGSGDMVYIAGIQYLYEFDYGELSGWIYRVNGETPSVGCKEYKLSDGDAIEWLYTCELGKDLE